MKANFFGKISVAISSGLGLGYLPKAPGTWGTLWGVLIFLGCQNLSLLIFSGVVIMALLLAVFFAHFAEAELKTHDSSHIISDEVVGYLVTVWGFSFSWQTAALAFVLFRLFDVWKPFPIRQVDRKMPGAWGVVLDDVVAGIYAHLGLRVLLFFWDKF